jgi:hypothetical protein
MAHKALFRVTSLTGGDECSPGGDPTLDGQLTANNLPEPVPMSRPGAGIAGLLLRGLAKQRMNRIGRGLAF